MAEKRSKAIFVALCLCLCSCPEQTNFVINIHRVYDKGDPHGSNCPQSEAFPGLSKNAYDLRFTFLKRSDKGKISPSNLREFEIVCDQAVPKNQELILSVPRGEDSESSQYMVLLEGFDPENNHALAYVGHAYVDFSQTEATIYLHKTGAISCQNTQMRTPRAFHTATLLPNGEVLMVGGLKTENSQAILQTKFLDKTQNTEMPTAMVEVYDPSTHEFETVKTDGPARLFHQAVLLPSEKNGPYKVLIIGGLESNTGDPVAFRTKDQYPFLFNPTDNAKAAENMILIYDPGTRGLDMDPVASVAKNLFPASNMTADFAKVLVASGAETYDETNGFGSQYNKSYWISGDPIGSQTTEGSALLNKIRVGHKILRLGKGNDQFLLLGGAMDQKEDDGSPFDCAEVISEDGSSTTPFVCDFDQTPATVWHTVTPIGQTDREKRKNTAHPEVAIWAGGFPLEEVFTGTNIQRAFEFELFPNQKPLHKIFWDGVKYQLSNDDLPDGFERTAYHDAIRLYDGSVLFTGGSCDYGTTFDCGSKQIVEYEIVDNEISVRPSSETMAYSRYGHRATRLFDNTVLITGGIYIHKYKNANGTTVTETRLLNVAEIYNPRSGDPVEDFIPADDTVLNDLANGRPKVVCENGTCTAGEYSPCTGDTNDVGQSESEMKMVWVPSSLTSKVRVSFEILPMEPN